jgi:hypothetical protein
MPSVFRVYERGTDVFPTRLLLKIELFLDSDRISFWMGWHLVREFGTLQENSAIFRQGDWREMNMWVIARIRKHISNIPDGQTFATRELLGYGHRDAVDAATSRLVKAEVIMRVARGIFVKPLYEKGILIMPKLADIVTTKAKAFGKEVLLQHGKDAAHALKISDSGNAEPTVVVTGSSTSFVCKSSDYGEVRVHLRCANALSRKFVNTHIGLFIRGMKSLPQWLRKLEIFEKARESFNRTQKEELRAAALWMPGWLSNMFWMPPGKSHETVHETDSCEFLRKYMTDEEYKEFLRLNVYPGLVPGITFTQA